MADAKEKKGTGRTFDMSVKTGTDGEAKWNPLGQVWIRDDGSGGAVFLKKEDFLKVCTVTDEKGQVVISLFPHRSRAKAGEKPAAKTEAA